MVEVMNTMGVDLTTFGNHEFDVGREALQKRINESTFAWTVANVLEDRGEGNTAPFRINRDIGNIPKAKNKIPPNTVRSLAGNRRGNSPRIIRT